MAGILNDAQSASMGLLQELVERSQKVPPPIFLAVLAFLLIGFAGLVRCSIPSSISPHADWNAPCVQSYVLLYIVAPTPRLPFPSEKTYLTILPDGSTSAHKQLPCWLDEWVARKSLASRQPGPMKQQCKVEDAEVFMSVVVPAFNEEERLGGMLEEAVEFLQSEYGDAHGADIEARSPSITAKSLNGQQQPLDNKAAPGENPARVGSGWEILVVSDGSTDRTEEYALNFARDHQLSQYPTPVPGPWKASPGPTNIPHGSIRVIRLEQNRGKGGAVTHGMRHARGQYVVFADADGASEITDLKKLVEGCQKIEDSLGRGVGIGSRNHLVGSEAVVKVNLTDPRNHTHY